MKTSYSFPLVIFILVSTLCSCSNKTINIEEINNRQQIDSIIAMLPPDSVVIDSVPVKTLYINLRGNFEYAGKQVSEINCTIIDETLQFLQFRTQNGAKDVLEFIENKYEIGNYNRFHSFTWEALKKNIELTFNKEIENLLTLDNETGTEIHFRFHKVEKNPITELYKEIPQDKTQEIYLIEIENYLCGYQIFLNGIESFSTDDKLNTFNSETFYINEYLPQNGKQDFQIKILPGLNKEGTSFTEKIHQEARITATLYKKETGRSKKTHIFTWFMRGNNFTRLDSTEVERHLEQQIDKPFYELTDTFHANINYKLDYISMPNLRSIPDLKNKVYAQYSLLKDALLKKNYSRIADLLYPLKRTEAIALHAETTPLSLQNDWKNLKSEVSEMKIVQLQPEDDLEFLFSNDGTLAKLTPKNKNIQNALFAETSQYIYDYSYYMGQNKKGELIFILK